MSSIRRLLVVLYNNIFLFLQRLGIHVTRCHFYSPIPDTNELDARKELWEQETELVGIDLGIEKQLDLLENVFPRFRNECDFPLHSTSMPYEYYINNGTFGLISAAVLHCMIRHFTPQRMIEVGSGHSTYVSARAAKMNEGYNGVVTNLISIDPYPNQILRKGFPGLSKVIPNKVEQVDIDIFSKLDDQDILFIDSSHVVRIGGDVNFLYLEVLPRLRKGVLVHIHDIFFPKHYPKDWVTRNQRFWTEQYILQAFLTYNNQFEVLWCGSYMYLKYLDKLKSTFPPPKGLGHNENYFSSSFWIRRVV